MNYQLELDKIIEGLGADRPRLLLHACCAPCSSYVLEYLTAYFDIDLFFYNPNIMPAEEYDRRLAAIHKLLAVMPSASGVRLIVGPRDTERFLEAVKGKEAEPEGGAEQRAPPARGAAEAGAGPCEVFPCYSTGRDAMAAAAGHEFAAECGNGECRLRGDVRGRERSCRRSDSAGAVFL